MSLLNPNHRLPLKCIAAAKAKFSPGLVSEPFHTKCAHPSSGAVLNLSRKKCTFGLFITLRSLFPFPAKRAKNESKWEGSRFCR